MFWKIYLIWYNEIDCYFLKKVCSASLKNNFCTEWQKFQVLSKLKSEMAMIFTILWWLDDFKPQDKNLPRTKHCVGGQKKHGIFFRYFCFLSLFFEYYVAVVSKIDFRFNCVNAWVWVFVLFLKYNYISYQRRLSVKKHKKLLFDLVLHRWWKILW